MTKNSRANSQPRVVADQAIAKLLAAPAIPDNGDALEMGRTRAAALAWWLRESARSTRARGGETLALVLAEMQRAPNASRHAFMEHLAHLIAAGSQQLDVAGDLAERNAHAPHSHIVAKW